MAEELGCTNHRCQRVSHAPPFVGAASPFPSFNNFLAPPRHILREQTSGGCARLARFGEPPLTMSTSHPFPTIDEFQRDRDGGHGSTDRARSETAAARGPAVCPMETLHRHVRKRDRVSHHNLRSQPRDQQGNRCPHPFPQVSGRQRNLAHLVQGRQGWGRLVMSTSAFPIPSVERADPSHLMSLPHAPHPTSFLRHPVDNPAPAASDFHLSCVSYCPRF